MFRFRSKLHPLPLAEDAGEHVGAQDECMIWDAHSHIETEEENHIGDAQNTNGDVADQE